MNFNLVKDIRDEFANLLLAGEFTATSKELATTATMGNRTLEIVSAAFYADEPLIFGVVNEEYVAREKEWYMSGSLNVNDIPGGAPAVWKQVADKDGLINSNYGFLIYDPSNGEQYHNVLTELQKNPESRRAVMIYQRPSMWTDYNLNGRSDFICTNAVQYLIRDGALHVVVQMRSNDAVFGMKNDFAWQQEVQYNLLADLNNKPLEEDELPLEAGHIHWNAGSLHVYERHFYMVDHYSKTGETSISKIDYINLYPDSAFK
jgi:thymidylate synthase